MEMEVVKSPSSIRKITPNELEKLNRKDNAAIAYRGKVYDVSSFIDRHPGGAKQLLLVAGRDITNFFEVYHDEKTRSLLSTKCKLIGSLEGPPVPSKTLDDDEMFLTLEKRVREYFKVKSIDPKINIPFFIASYLILAATVMLWFSAVALAYKGYSMLFCSLLALVSGFCAAINGIAGGHDISHFSWTHSPLVWKYVGALYSSVHGLSTYIWSYQHVIGHHMHPNHDQLDPDVSTKDIDFWRIKPFQPRSSHYFYQHMYMPLLFSLLSIKMKIQDFHSLAILRKANVPVNPPTFDELVIFLVTKAIHIFYRWVLPAFYITLPQLLLLNLLSEIVMGSWLGRITQVNHVNAGLKWHKKNALNADMAWSKMQVGTTADYATDSILWNFITGGLNLQVIHHMFPWVLSFNLRYLVPVVKETLAEFGVEYHYYDTYWDIWCAHVQYLKEMGRSNGGSSDKLKVG